MKLSPLSIVALAGLLVLSTVIFQLTPYFRLQLAALLILLLIISFYSMRYVHPQLSIVHHYKLFFLFILILIVQFVVVGTGGIYSPFLILVHILIIGTTFFFGFSVSLLFLLVSGALLFYTTVTDPAFQTSFLSDPGPIAFYVISLLLILPIAYLLDKHYHIQDNISKLLTDQLQLQDVLLADIDELIFVTDPALKILSINEAVERTLHLSEAQLLGHLFLKEVFIKLADGKLADEDSFTIKEIIKTKTQKLFTDLTLFTPSDSLRKVSVQISPHSNADGAVTQLSFIIHVTSQKEQEKNPTYADLQQATVRYEAKVEDLKNQLSKNKLNSLKEQVSNFTKIQRDISLAQTLEGHDFMGKDVFIDLAALSKQILVREEDTANALHVSLDFELPDFSEKDIQPLLAGTFVISPDQLTGPFFTITSDVRYVSVILENLLNLAICLASGTKQNIVRMSINRSQNTEVILTITGGCENLRGQEGALFTKYYANLSSVPTLQNGSGLEGFLAKTLIDNLQIPFQVQVASDDSQITFSLHFSKSQK